MNWYKSANMIKVSNTQYLYHGTGVQNLSVILSEGLNANADKLYDDEMEHGSIRTYGGVYLTDNIMTAMSSAGKSSYLSHSKEKGLIIVKIEDTTPHIVLDEDNFSNPAYAIDSTSGYHLTASHWHPENMAYFILNTLPATADDITNNYLQRVKGMYYEDSDQRVFNALFPYARDVVETYCYSVLSAQINRYFQGSHEYEKRIFEEKYPQFADMTEELSSENYRFAHNILIQKAHRLTSNMKDYFSANVRSMENITYKGKNKVVMVSSFLNNGVNDKYYTEVNVLYLSDNACLEKLSDDIHDRYSPYLIIRYNDEVLYDNPRVKEPEHELV